MNSLQKYLIVVLLPFFVLSTALMYNNIGEPAPLKWHLRESERIVTFQDFVEGSIVYLVGWIFIIFMAGIKKEIPDEESPQEKDIWIFKDW